jgi:hypothetical protein
VLSLCSGPIALLPGARGLGKSPWTFTAFASLPFFPVSLYSCKEKAHDPGQMCWHLAELPLGEKASTWAAPQLSLPLTPFTAGEVRPAEGQRRKHTPCEL